MKQKTRTNSYLKELYCSKCNKIYRADQVQ